MITGDSVVTAANIAQQVGIISENDQPGKIMVAS
jgi:magnesium-transporting ATPase (P-type)